MALSFIFDASKETPQSLAKKRAVAEALGGRSRAPQNVGEGLTALGEALGYRMMMSDVDKGEAAGREHAAATMAPLFGSFPEAPHTTSAPGAGSTVSSAEAPDMNGNQIYSEFMDTVKKGGVDNPYALAAIAATGKAESGFSPGNVFRTWSDPSESGQAGTAGGIMSWRADRLSKMQDFAAANGGDRTRPSPALQAQFLLQEDPNLITALQGAKSAEEAQRLMNNAWQFAGYNRPGGEAARRIGLANSFASQFAGSPAPVQVASLDPSAGIAEATTQQTVPPMPEEYAKTGLSQDAWARMNAPDGAPVAKPAAVAQPAEKPAATSPAAQRVLAAMMTPKSMAYAPQDAKPTFPQVTAALEKATQPQQPAAPAPATARVAQALGGAEAYRGTAIDSDMPGHEPLQPGEAGPTVQQLMQAASNPWLSEQQRGMVSMMLEQKMQAADPIRKLQLQKLQKELGTPQKLWQKLDDNTLFDPASGETKSVGKPNDGKFRFQGNSVEAQSLNGLMDSGALTPDQAQQLGAGKTITDPATGSIMFMTPQGVFGQAAPGAPATPVTPQAAPAAPASPSPAPAPSPAASTPTAAPPASPDGRPGMIQITDPKAQKPTEAQRNRSANVDQAFSTITNELDRYAELVDKTGVEAMPGKAKDNLNTVRQGIMLQMKELFNLGVLNGPDLSLMERMIYDPVIDPLKEGGLANLPDQLLAAANGSAGERAKNSVAELKRMLTNIKTSVDTSVGQQKGGATPAPTGDAGGWKDMGNGVKIRVKQ